MAQQIHAQKGGFVSQTLPLPKVSTRFLHRFGFGASDLTVGMHEDSRSMETHQAGVTDPL
jgi:hypothetical protein